MVQAKEHILVIRAGALGDLVFCFQSFAEIRAAHPDAEIALLTREPFTAFARAMPWFDRVITDTHPTFAKPLGWARLVHEIKKFAPTRIYDLQGKNRQAILYCLLGGPLGPAWSGAAPGCKFPRLWPPTPDMHFTGFLAAQLRAAHVSAAPPVTLGWLDAPTERFSLPQRYVVLVPGCSPNAPHKRWPPRSYAELANKFYSRGIICVAVGTAADAAAIDEIKRSTPNIVDLCGQTNLHEVAGIMRRAAGVIGNDTGPVHMAGAVGAPTLALFSKATNPVWSRPPGPNTAWKQSLRLEDLSADAVLTAFTMLLQHTERKSG